MALYKRGKIWYADFSVDGHRYQVSLRTTDWREAQTKEKELVTQAMQGKLAHLDRYAVSGPCTPLYEWSMRVQGSAGDVRYILFAFPFTGRRRTRQKRSFSGPQEPSTTGNEKRPL